MFVDCGAAAGVAVSLALDAAKSKSTLSSSTVCPGLGFALKDSNVTAIQEQLVTKYKQRIHGPL